MTITARRRWTAWTRWPNPEEGPYHVGLTWSAEGDKRAELVGFELWSRPPGAERVNDGPEGDVLDFLPWPTPAVTARLLHDFPLGRVSRSTRDQAVTTLAGEAAVDAAEGLRPQSRPRYPIDHYEMVARRYLSTPPGQSIYEWIQLAMPASKSTVAHWVARCRALGLLPRHVRRSGAVQSMRSPPLQDTISDAETSSH